MRGAATKSGEDTYERILRYLGSFPDYVTEALYIRTKAARLEPFQLNFAQRYVHSKLSEQMEQTGRVRALILKSRQLGMSTLVAGRFFRRCNLTPQQRAVILADKKERAGLLHGIYDRFYRYLPIEIKPKTRASQRAKHLIFDSSDSAGLGCEIVVETAGDSAAGRGATIQLLHASELAFWPNAEDVWVAVMQAIPDVDSEVIVESTANGVGGLFYELCMASVAGENDFILIFLPWFIHEEYVSDITPLETADIATSADPYEREAQDVGFAFDGELVRLTPAQLAWRRRTIRNKLRGDVRAFRQEYPSNIDEAFLVTGACFFDEDALRGYKSTSRMPLARGDIVWKGGGMLFRPSQRGFIRVWEWPNRDGRYVAFADPATGKQVATDRGSFGDPENEKGGRDFSSVHVYEMDTRRYVAAFHARVAPEALAEACETLGYFYSSPGRADQGNVRVPAFLGVESQGSGETVLRILQAELRYPNLYYQRQVNRRTNAVTTMLGWHTNVETRPIMLDDFAAAIRTDGVDLPDGDAIAECFTFVRNDAGKPEAMSGCHDDRIISAAGCLQMARWAPPPPSAIPEAEAQLSSPTGLFDY